MNFNDFKKVSEIRKTAKRFISNFSGKSEKEKQINMANLKSDANGIIIRHVLYSMGVGTIPIPLIDLTAVTAVQLDMVKQLTRLYGQNHDENIGKAFIASLTSSTLARMGASMIKAIPGIGTLIGGVSMSITSGASTYALGNVVVNFLSANIPLDEVDEDLAKEMYKEEYEEGKKVASNLKKKQDTKKATKEEPKTAEKDIYAELSKLGELKDKNIITDEEFEKMKKEIIDRF